MQVLGFQNPKQYSFGIFGGEVSGGREQEQVVTVSYSCLMQGGG